jgi:hypothetical protein
LDQPGFLSRSSFAGRGGSGVGDDGAGAGRGSSCVSRGVTYVALAWAGVAFT